MTTPHPPIEDHRIDTPNGRLFARVWRSREGASASGERAPIVLFHDSLGCVDLWRQFPAHLSARTGRTVVAYDRLGFGRSDPFRGEWSGAFIHQEAEATFPLLREQLGIGAFIGFGHSVGGAMAALCAAAFPADCRALVMESSQAFVEERTRQGIRDAQAGFEQDAQFGRLEKYHGDKARWVLEAWTETWLSPAFTHWNLDAELSGVLCPTLVIHGEQDEFGSVQHPHRIAEATSGQSHVAILAGCRHVPHREDEEAVLTLAERFLQAAVSGDPSAR